jgi:hypothetical protein
MFLDFHLYNTSNYMWWDDIAKDTKYCILIAKRECSNQMNV